MNTAEAQKVLHSTGSFTGFRPLQELGSNYLAGTANFRQPLCGNEEGWGPLSPFRYDFTPCFIDVWIATVAVFGLLFGSIAIWWLVTKTSQTLSTAKNWHFWIKQVSYTSILCHHLARLGFED
jgi:ATP-binding cassette, subfamily C (CFTR/MRP), member 1